MHPVKSVRALRFLGMLSLEDDTILDLSIQLKKKQSLWSWARTVESGTSRAVLWMCCFQVGSQRLKHGRLRQPWFSFPLPFWKRKKVCRRRTSPILPVHAPYPQSVEEPVKPRNQCGFRILKCEKLGHTSWWQASAALGDKQWVENEDAPKHPMIPMALRGPGRLRP